MTQNIRIFNLISWLTNPYTIILRYLLNYTGYERFAKMVAGCFVFKWRHEINKKNNFSVYYFREWPAKIFEKKSLPICATEFFFALEVCWHARNLARSLARSSPKRVLSGVFESEWAWGVGLLLNQNQARTGKGIFIF